MARAIEYSPIADLATSQQKLSELAKAEKLEDQILDEVIKDVLASRGGERWKDLYELWLQTRNNQRLVVSFKPPMKGIPEPHTNISIQPNPELLTYQDYAVLNRGNGKFKLVRTEIRDDSYLEYEAVNNSSGANKDAAYLVVLLADAHQHSPLEELKPDDYKRTDIAA